MNLDRIRSALDRAQHGGYTLTPREAEILYGLEQSSNPRQLGSSPLDRRVVVRHVEAKGRGVIPQTLERLQRASDRAEVGGFGVKSPLVDALERPKPPLEFETPLDKRLRENAVRTRREIRKLREF